MARKKEIIGLVVFAFIFGLVILCFSPVLHSYLNKRTVEIIKKKVMLDSCTVSKVSLTLFRGLLIHDLLCIKKIDRERRLRAEIPITRINYRALQTFKNWGKIQASLKTTPPKNNRRKQTNKKYLLNYLCTIQIKPDTLLYSCINTVVFERGIVSIDSLGTRASEVNKLRGAIRIPKEDSSILMVKLTADDCKNRRIQVKEPQITLKLDGSHCAIKKFSCHVFEGTLEAQADCNVLYNKINRAHIILNNADLHSLYMPFKGEEGSLGGKCTIVLDIDTSTTEFNLLDASGSVTLSKVTADSIPMITKIALSLDIEKLSHLTFKKIQGFFNVNKGKILIDSLEGEGDPLSLNMDGYVKPETGYFNFKVNGIFDGYYEDSLSAIAWNTLIPEDDGRRSFICTIYGTSDNPTVSLDLKLMRRAVKNTFRDIKNGLRSIFRRRK